MRNEFLAVLGIDIFPSILGLELMEESASCCLFVILLFIKKKRQLQHMDFNWDLPWRNIPSRPTQQTEHNDKK